VAAGDTEAVVDILNPLHRPKLLLEAGKYFIQSNTIILKSIATSASTKTSFPFSGAKNEQNIYIIYI